MHHLYHGIRPQLRPQGVIQEEVVLDIAQLLWRKQRVHIGTQLACRDHPDADAGKKRLEGQRAIYVRNYRETRTLFRSASGGKSAAFGDQYCFEAIDKAMSPNAEGNTLVDGLRDKVARGLGSWRHRMMADRAFLPSSAGTRQEITT